MPASPAIRRVILLSSLLFGLLLVLAASPVQAHQPFQSDATPTRKPNVRPGLLYPRVYRTGDVTPYCEDPRFTGEYNVFKQGKAVTLVFIWEASTRQQVQDHLNTTQMEIKVDGKVIPDVNKPAYRTIIYPKYPNWRVTWYIAVPKPAVGEHRVEYQQTWTEAIGDGWDTFGPGTKNELYAYGCSFTIY
jgi:hypothetical protein